uniref:Citrate transporter-like domain-containing protein n=1 Tax=Oryza brachyantha TaxID=4533 RepID=J3L7H7_ORYBR
MTTWNFLSGFYVPYPSREGAAGAAALALAGVGAGDGDAGWITRSLKYAHARKCACKDLLFRVCFVSAIASALFTNDTTCVVLVEFILKVVRQNSLPSQPFLIVLDSFEPIHGVLLARQGGSRWREKGERERGTPLTCGHYTFFLLFILAKMSRQAEEDEIEQCRSHSLLLSENCEKSDGAHSDANFALIVIQIKHRPEAKSGENARRLLMATTSEADPGVLQMDPGLRKEGNGDTWMPWTTLLGS